MKNLVAVLLVLIFAVSTLAQDRPMRGGGMGDGPMGMGPGPGGPDGGGGGGGMPPGGPGGMDGPPNTSGNAGGPGASAGPGMGGGPGGNRRFANDPVDRMRGYLEMVNRFVQVSRDPTEAAVASVLSAGDILRPKGAAEAINYFTKLLPDVKSATVARAIKLQLIDLYRQSQQNDKALAEIESLLKAAPAETSPASPDTK